ncbi:MAG: efflux RND transporter permease subunit, partial [Hyphomonadaceae bacterium]
VQLPPGASAERTRAVMDKIEAYYSQNEKDTIRSYFSVVGFGFAGVGQNQGIMFVLLKDWSERPAARQRAPAIIGRAFGALSQIRDGMVFPILPPAVTSLGFATGFDMQLVNTANLPREQFLAARNQLLGMAAQDRQLMQVRPNGQEDTPQLHLNIDQRAASTLGVSIPDINTTLAGAWGGVYVNDFIDRGRIKRVYMQGDAPYRMRPEDLGVWNVRAASGEMAPFSAFTTADWALASPRLERFNGAPSFNVQGQGAPGVSSGQAMMKMEELAKRLPPGVTVGWQGTSFEERQSGAQAPALYALSLIVVFLCLAALYESWTIPIAVLVVVPLGLLGAALAANLRGLSNDIYFQVGLLTTMGLAAKNAILIVEFARNLAEQGRTLSEAAMEAARIRMRPILMTSFAFIFGVLPMAIASGAGSGAQNAIGTAVIGGMFAATLLVTVFTPFFFVGISGLFARNWFRRPPAVAAPAPAPQPGPAE